MKKIWLRLFVSVRRQKIDEKFFWDQKLLDYLLQICLVWKTMISRHYGDLIKKDI